MSEVLDLIGGLAIGVMALFPLALASVALLAALLVPVAAAGLVVILAAATVVAPAVAIRRALASRSGA